MKKRIKIIIITSILSILSQQALSLEKKDITIIANIKQEIKEQPLNKLDILMDEKQRVRSIVRRRLDKDNLKLSYNYIRNTKYTKHEKGLMREASYYMKYIIKNSKDRDKIKKEAVNISWNAICLSSRLKDGTGIVFEILEEINVDDINRDKYKEGSQLLLDIFSEETTIPSKEEIKLRCFSFYDNTNIEKLKIKDFF